MFIKRTLILILVFCVSISIFAQNITSPQEFLGYKIGTDKKLADTKEIFSYFKKLSEESERIIVNNLGKTTEGNDFYLAVISSRENLRNIEGILKVHNKLADPRGTDEREFSRLKEEAKTIIEINCAIHSTEIASTQMSMKLAYTLASTNDNKILDYLDNVVLLLVPIHNPDGHQMVTDWYEKYVGTEYEGCRMPWLYHKYVGHDNNRDWYYFSQKETQITVRKIYNVWHPMIIVDMHQMGNTGARMFVPPFTDPIEPNVDPIITQNISTLGTYITAELTSQGKRGVVYHTGFDAWTPARAYMHYHGGIRILTEAASARIASPVIIKPENIRQGYKTSKWNFPLPWEGGRWSIGDIVDYEFSTAMAVLKHASNNRDFWVNNFYRIGKNAVNFNGEPFAYIIPEKQKSIPELIKMLNVLQTGEVEINVTTEEFEYDGYKFEEGTYVIFSAQPYGAFARALLSKQLYPEIRDYPNGPLKRPYDATAHNLPLLMGVNVIEAKDGFDVKFKRIDKIGFPSGKFITSGEDIFGYINEYFSNEDVRMLNRLLKHDNRVYWLATDVELNGDKLKSGSLFIPAQPNITNFLKGLCSELPVDIKGIGEEFNFIGYEIEKPRVGMYKSHTASMDEGWTRFVLDQYEFDYNSIFNDEIRKGDLENLYDIIIIPDINERSIINGISDRFMPPEYAGGIGEAGLDNLKKFVQNGGTIVGLNNSCDFLINNFWLSVTNITNRIKSSEFYIPGSILKLLLNENHPLAFGLGREINVMFYYSPVFESEEGDVIGKYPPSNPLLSGWIQGEDYIVNKSAILETEYGEGKIILIGFRPQYRAQSEGSFKILFNSIFYSSADLINEIER